jgi:hypothetical protein
VRTWPSESLHSRIRNNQWKPPSVKAICDQSGRKGQEHDRGEPQHVELNEARAVTPQWSEHVVVNHPVVGDDDEGQSEREQRGLVVHDYVGEGCARGPIDFSERKDEQGNGDRDDAVAEGNHPVDAYFSFTCHLIAPRFRKISSSKQAG